VEDMSINPQTGRYQRVVRGAFLLTATVLLGSLGFVVVEGYPPLDALYMTIITISTVGYGEVHHLSSAGQVMVMVLIVIGLGLVTYTVGAIATLLVEGQVHKLFGRRMMRRELDAIRNHYIVCGHGRMGQIVCEELAAEGKPHVIITLDEEEAEQLSTKGRLALFGDATEDEVLLRAGVTRAKALVATTSRDVDNLYITLSARELARAENPTLYILARAAEDKAANKIRHAGADRVISPYRIGGSRLVQALLRPKVYDYMEVAMTSQGIELLVEQFVIPVESYLDGVIIRSSDLRSEYDVIIIGINDVSGNMLFNPGPDQLIHAGDTLILLGAKSQLQRLEKALGA
jgi:voltage-gated potassium channel